MPKGSWFPGGIGLHGCPGIPFAMLISKVGEIGRFPGCLFGLFGWVGWLVGWLGWLGWCRLFMDPMGIYFI